MVINIQYVCLFTNGFFSDLSLHFSSTKKQPDVNDDKNKGGGRQLENVNMNLR